MTPLETLPDFRIRRIIVGGAVRKPIEILRPFLDSLSWQEWPKQVEPHFVFVADWPEPNVAEEYLRNWLKERNGELLASHQRPPANDFSDAPGLDSHQWTPASMARVGAHKNQLLRRCIELKADAVWYVDADLILDRSCFASLDACDKPITTAVFWTRWSRGGSETRKIWASPQVWLTQPYGLSGRGMDEAEFRSKLTSRGLTRVYGFGACTLLKRAVIEAGIDFSYVPGAPMEGLWAGEDRHLCLKAELRHIDAWADNWPDIFHIYHSPDDVQRIPEMVARLSAPHPTRAQLGDLVSIRLRALEPLPSGPGRFHQMAPQAVRGRLGTMPIAPELEEAIYELNRADRKIVRVHHPLHHPMPYLRGRTRLIELSLLDVRPFGFPPVLENDVYVGKLSQTVRHHEDITPDQHESIQEVASA
jgi:hypothetical protein